MEGEHTCLEPNIVASSDLSPVNIGQSRLVIPADLQLPEVLAQPASAGNQDGRPIPGWPSSPPAAAAGVAAVPQQPDGHEAAALTSPLRAGRGRGAAQAINWPLIVQDGLT